MVLFRKMLLPVDGSRTAKASIHYAAQLAAAEGAELHLLHVDDGSRFDGFNGPGGSHIVLAGAPAAIIAEYADRIEADVILMPSRSRGALGQLLLGSVTRDVLTRTMRPVWVVNKRRLTSNPDFRSRRVLCGVELGVRGRKVVRYAARIAAGWDAALVIVHVTPEISEAMLAIYGLDETGEIELLPDEARQRLAPIAAEIAVPFELDITTGNVADCLRRAAKKHGAGLVVIGRGRQTGSARMGANTMEIISRSVCPVIAVGERNSKIAAIRGRASLRTFPAAAFSRFTASISPARA
jgi:nucleotide-binding universal stress UspA family protein